MGRAPRLLSALAGLLAGALTLAVAQVLAALVSPSSAPLVAVGGAFVDLTPGWLKDFAVVAFGTNDKLVLVAGMVLTLAALSAAAGLVAAWRWLPGALLVVVLGLVAAAAAASRPGAGQLDVLPSVVGAIAGLLALRALVDRLPREQPSPQGRRDPDRRAFLVAAGLAAGATLVVGAGSWLAGTAGRTVAAARRALRLPDPTSPAPPLPRGVEVDVPDVSPFVTSNGAFYRIDTALVLPQVDAGSWRLRVHGLVEREVEIGFDDLLDQDLVEAWVTLTCVSNEVGGDLAGNAKWLGWPVRDLLARAGVRDGADMVLSTSTDGFTASTPLEVLTDERHALLAVGMNDEPLPVAHGYPVRLVVPGLYGYVSATKWVVDLEVTRFADRTAYWTDRGWAPRAPVKTMSRIDVPALFAQVAPGQVAVAGVAWAQHRGISAVEVRVDDGDWKHAQLATEATVDTWRQWWFPWDATPGEHSLTVRATDGTGQVQTGDQAPPVPDGATGWHTRRVTVG